MNRPSGCNLQEPSNKSKPMKLLHLAQLHHFLFSYQFLPPRHHRLRFSTIYPEPSLYQCPNISQAQIIFLPLRSPSRHHHQHLSTSLQFLLKNLFELSPNNNGVRFSSLSSFASCSFAIAISFQGSDFQPKFQSSLSKSSFCT